MDFEARLAARLGALRRAGLERHPPAIAERDGVRYRLEGRPVVGFCSNDYLGLSDLRDSPRSTAPSGAGGSRLICGDLPEHRALETTIAQWVGSADAVLFPSGFQLNVGVLATVLEAGDVAFSDALNHASLIDGLRLARCQRIVVPHRTPPGDPIAGRYRWWISESIFSMDGDGIDLDAARRHLDTGGCLYLDEAHALGLFAHGRGLAGTALRPTVLVGTLSKALGCAGAFVAGSAALCRLVRARCRSFVFSTGVSPALLPRIDHAIAIVRGTEGDRLRKRLWANVRDLAAALGVDPSPAPIFPLLIGENADAVELADELTRDGFHVQPIRPPTVPEGTARLRITVSAAHEPVDIERFGEAVKRRLRARGLKPHIERGRAQPLGQRSAAAAP